MHCERTLLPLFAGPPLRVSSFAAPGLARSAAATCSSQTRGCGVQCRPRRPVASVNLTGHNHPETASGEVEKRGAATLPAGGGGGGGGAPDTPWQLASSPVYAVCTTSAEVGRANMSIATYTTPCGRGTSPKFAVSLRVGTLTWVSVRQTRRARLMLLAEGHAELVPILGQLSGRDVDKVAEVRALGYEVRTSKDGVPFLPGALGYVDVVVDQWIDATDHELAICSVVNHLLLHQEHRPLSTGFLRDGHILS
jgi:flavin reductase (DIM6/NTAB) family NADH-FMN oxidoreductase RutF